MDLILYSADRDDLKMLEAATLLAEDIIDLYAFFDNAAWTGPGGALFGYRDILVLQATSLTGWGMSTPSILVNDLNPKSDKLILEADFYIRHMDWFSHWLHEAQRFDFFSAFGKFYDPAIVGRSAEFYEFAFPSWECVFISKALWNASDMGDHLRKLPLHATLDERFYHEQFFYGHFSKTHRFGCAIDQMKTTQFDPAKSAQFSLSDVWQARVAPKQPIIG